MKKLITLVAGLLLMTPFAASAISIGANGSYLLSNNGIKYYDTGAQSVVLTDTDGVDDDATAFLLLETAGFANSNSFGIYGFTGSGSSLQLGNTLEVFAGPDAPTSEVTLKFDLAAGTVTNMITSLSAEIGKYFGFYIATPNGTFYTHTALNLDGEDHFKVYNTSANNGTGFSAADVVLGIEDLNGLGDRDFNDMVVGVTDVSAVPEPGTMVLLGFGMLGLAIYGKRRMNKNQA